MGLLNVNLNKKITRKFLEENGFELINWGSPDYFSHPKPPIDHRNAMSGSTPHWRKFSYAYELTINQKIYVYFFPSTFKKYTIWGHLKNTAVGVFCTSGDLTKNLIISDIKTSSDLAAAIILLGNDKNYKNPQTTIQL